MRRYGAGRAGVFLKCTLCDKRWKWNEATQEWIDAPPKDIVKLMKRTATR